MTFQKSFDDAALKAADFKKRIYKQPTILSFFALLVCIVFCIKEGFSGGTPVEECAKEQSDLLRFQMDVLMKLGVFLMQLALKHVEISLCVLWRASACFAWHRIAITMKAGPCVPCSRLALRLRRATCEEISSSLGPIPSNTASPIGPFHFRHLSCLAGPSAFRLRSLLGI